MAETQLSSPELVPEQIPQQVARNEGRYCCGLFKKKDRFLLDMESSPDFDFHADSLTKLTHGVTAYRMIEPKETNGVAQESLPLIVCLHGFTNCSYMWADVADLLSDFEQGPQARVLVFDFYGRGRSPWTGVNITLDTLVTQTKELMDFLGLTKKPAAFVGYDLGASVAAGFSAKYPNLCASLSLISALGIKYKPLVNERMLNRKYFGEWEMSKEKKRLAPRQEIEFFDKDAGSTHRYLIEKQTEMVRWQIKNTPGYLGALLSTYRYFPLRGMEELYTAIGRHPRKTLIVWGDHDVVCPYRKCVKLMEESFPRGSIVDVLDCGHNCVLEKFEEVVRELLAFNREVFEAVKSSSGGLSGSLPGTPKSTGTSNSPKHNFGVVSP